MRDKVTVKGRFRFLEFVRDQEGFGAHKVGRKFPRSERIDLIQVF